MKTFLLIASLKTTMPNVNLNNMLKTKLLPYSNALALIENIASQYCITSAQTCQLNEAPNRLLAEDVLSPINVPSFNNSAMDGFAVQTHIVNNQIKKTGTITLKVSGSIQAGDCQDIDAENKHLAWEIMTGAPVPDLFDGVIQIENVTINEVDNYKTITLTETVQKGRNIRKLGTDYRINEIVANKHAIIQAQHIMALATVGIQQIQVLKRIKVAILSTGNELAKKSSTSLNSGKIFNSNQPFLKSYSQNLNCEPTFIGHCKDNIDAFNILVDEAIKKDVKIIFSTGAVSMGKYDFIPQALLALGAKIHFHKAKIRPGKPILFAELPDGIIYFGLPGNPIAAAAGMRFFVSPFIRKMLGLTQEKILKAKAVTNISKKKGFRTFAKAQAHIDETGQLCVKMLMDQGSYQSCSFAQSNCWLILPEESESIKKGELVNIVPMIPNQMVL